jgi:hypothetical protein
MKSIDVLTNRYDNFRRGANLNETTLTHENVNVNDFEKLFTRGVDGQIYAQPLIVSDVAFPRIGRRPVVIVATTRNMVYAFDAEDPDACHPIWLTNLDAGGSTPVPRRDYGSGYLDFSGEIGVTSTPVIDKRTRTVYLTSKSKLIVADKPHFRYRIFALSLLTGKPKLRSPVVIADTVVNDLDKHDDAADFTFVAGPTADGSGSGSADGKITFNAFLQHQATGLLLQDGAIYLGFGSTGDRGSYHGWVLAYDAKTLDLLASYCTTPNWGEGGIWQSGCGLAADREDYIYAVCGNGTYKYNGKIPGDDQLGSGPCFGHAVLKLKLDRAGGKLSLVDWFVPFDIVCRNKADDDLCAGPVLLPDDETWSTAKLPSGKVGAWGKDRAYYILDTANLGKFTPHRNNIHQYAPDMTKVLREGAVTAHIHCAPVMFTDPSLGPISYVWSENDSLRGYPFDAATGKFATTPQAKLLSTDILPQGMPGGMLAISSNGKKPGTAIVWALHPTCDDANNRTVAGTFQAFKADDLRTAIWTSEHDVMGSDDVGDFAKFCSPVIANGKVYVATFSRELAVYGLLREKANQRIDGKWLQADIPVPAQRSTFHVEGTASLSCHRFTILGAGIDIWGGSDDFHYVYQEISGGENGGAVTITARVRNILTPADEWAKAGVMIRETLDADSAHAMMVITPAHGAAFQYRAGKGAQSTHVPSALEVKAPYWVRLVRAPQDGSFQFTGFVSSNGTEWKPVGSTNSISMKPAALAGMAVTAHADRNNDTRLQDLCTAVLDRVDLKTQVVSD